MVFHDVANAGSVQPIFFREDGGLAILKAGQSSIVIANPQVPCPVLINGMDMVCSQPIFRGQGPYYFSMAKFCHAAAGAEPQRAVAVLGNSRDCYGFAPQGVVGEFSIPAAA